MTKLYIAGPMTGVYLNNVPAFHQAAKELESVGYEVINPAPYENPAFEWVDYMKRDIPLLLSCDAVAMLPRSRDSRGAQLEFHIARQLGMDVHPVSWWLARYPQFA